MALQFSSRQPPIDVIAIAPSHSLVSKGELMKVDDISNRPKLKTRPFNRKFDPYFIKIERVMVLPLSGNRFQ